MKFIVEIEDFYLDEDENLMPAIKSEVVRNVTNQIWDRVKEDVKRSVVDPLVTKIKSQVDVKIAELMMIEFEDILKTQTFKPQGYSTQMTFAEFIEMKMNQSTYSNLQETVKKLADMRANEIKQRYDLIFASQIVSKLNDNGMLKENIASLLLERK